MLASEEEEEPAIGRVIEKSLESSRGHAKGIPPSRAGNRPPQRRAGQHTACVPQSTRRHFALGRPSPQAPIVGRRCRQWYDCPPFPAARLLAPLPKCVAS